MPDAQEAKKPLERTNILNGLRWTYFSVVTQGFLKLAVLMTLTRLLTPRDFGLLGFALICTNLIERVGQLGVAPALVQVAQMNVNLLVTAQRLSLGLGILSSLAVFYAAPFMSEFFSEPSLIPILQVLSIGCLLEALSSVPDAMLQRQLHFRQIMIADNLSYFLGMLVIGGGLALLGLGVWALVIAAVVLKFIRLVTLVHLCPIHGSGNWSYSDAKKLLSLGVGFSLGRLLNFFSLQGDNFVVGRLLGVEALGMYSRAYQLMTLPAMYVGQVFERVMFPAMSRSQGEIKKLSQDFLASLEVITLIAMPAGVVMFVLSREIVLVGFGERWAAVIPVVSILSFGVFFRTAYKCSDTVTRSVGAVYHYAARQFLYALLVIGGAIIGSIIYGIEGVAVGVVAAVGLNYLSMTRLSTTILGLSYREVLAAHTSGVLVSTGVGIALVGITNLLRDMRHSPLLILLEAGASAVFTWMVAVLLVGLFFRLGVIPRGIYIIARTLMKLFRHKSFLDPRESTTGT